MKLKFFFLIFTFFLNCTVYTIPKGGFCQFCNQHFSSYLERHEYSCEQNSNRRPPKTTDTCKFCKKPYQNIDRHEQECAFNPYGLKSSPCPYCGKMIKYIEKHKKICTKAPDNEKATLICLLCNKKCPNKFLLNRHIESFCKHNFNRCQPKTAGPCQFCKQYYRKIGVHEKRCKFNPDGLKKYPCPYCKKKFKHLKAHSELCQKNPENQLIHKFKISKQKNRPKTSFVTSIKKIATQQFTKEKENKKKLADLIEDSAIEFSEENQLLELNDVDNFLSNGLLHDNHHHNNQFEHFPKIFEEEQQPAFKSGNLSFDEDLNIPNFFVGKNTENQQLNFESLPFDNQFDSQRPPFDEENVPYHTSFTNSDFDLFSPLGTEGLRQP